MVLHLRNVGSLSVDQNVNKFCFFTIDQFVAELQQLHQGLHVIHVGIV